MTVNEPGDGYVQDNPLVAWGTYTFDVRVEEIGDEQDLGVGEPVQDWRSTKLFIPPFYDAAGVQKPGHYLHLDVDDEHETMKARVGYYLEDNEGAPLADTRNASSGNIDFIDPQLEVKGSAGLQAEVRTPHDNIDLYTFGNNEDGGTYRAIFMAQDDHGSAYRNHQNKRMMPVNATAQAKAFHIEDDWMHDRAYGDLNPQARSYELRKAFFLTRRSRNQRGSISLVEIER